MCELLPVLFAAFMPCYCFVGRYLGWWHKKVEDCSYIYLRSNIDGVSVTRAAMPFDR